MQIYCVNCKNNTGNKDALKVILKNGRLMLKSYCSVCGNKKSRFVKERKAKGLLSSLGIRTPLSKILG